MKMEKVMVNWRRSWLQNKFSFVCTMLREQYGEYAYKSSYKLPPPPHPHPLTISLFDNTSLKWSIGFLKLLF